MGNSNLEKSRLKAEDNSDAESCDDEWMDVYLDKPINTREYFKLLGYCVAGLISIGLVFAVFFKYFS